MAKTKKRSGSRKSSSGSSGSSSKQRKSTTSTSASATKRGRSRRANKSSRISNGKASARTSNGNRSPRVGNARGDRFGGITRALKLTGIGTAGGVVTRLGADAGLNLAFYAAPQFGLLQHWLARPAIGAVFAMFGTPRIFRMVGFNPESAESARIGGLIAAGFDFVDGALPNSRERLASKFQFGRGQQRQVVTNARTAITDGAAEQLIDNAAAAGAQAGAAAAMAGLGMMDDEGMIDSINEEDSGYLPGGDEYDADWDVGEDY